MLLLGLRLGLRDRRNSDSLLLDDLLNDRFRLDLDVAVHGVLVGSTIAIPVARHELKVVSPPSP